MQNSFDIIVIGSGIAGLSYALKVAKMGFSVAIITKKDKAESSTNYAQGGIACVTSSEDDFKLHIEDTLIAGDGLCDINVVEKIVKEGPLAIQELIDIGVKFTQLSDGSASLGKEGGHSKRRILHVKDLTGKAIEEALLNAINLQENAVLLEHFLAIDLITTSKLNKEESSFTGNRILGLYALDKENNKVTTFEAKIVMLATGGIGQVYAYTTNPSIATGDGIAMGYRAGVPVKNMEFIQFHPTTLYSKDYKRFLITEAARGEGARLLDINKQPFMHKYDKREELAPRDVVARAIDSEMKESGATHLWLDFTHKSKDFLIERFPNIYDHCKGYGIDISKDHIPIVPAAHYLCGGLETNTQGETVINGLYACGETACTGLHGANRLASNSLLEAVVVANNAASASEAYLKKLKVKSEQMPDWIDGNLMDSDERVVLQHNTVEIKQTMWDYVGIVRTHKRLERAEKRIKYLEEEINEYYWSYKVEPHLLELRNMITIAKIIVKAAKAQTENKGLHYSLDLLSINK